MKKNMLSRRLVLLMIIIIVTSFFSVRDSVIVQSDWKHTSGGNLGTDFFFFTEDSEYRYSCPLIKKNEKIIGIALFQLNGRLMVYSVSDTSLAFFMTI